jgi:hypothetical protein
VDHQDWEFEGIYWNPHGRQCIANKSMAAIGGKTETSVKRVNFCRGNLTDLRSSQDLAKGNPK